MTPGTRAQRRFERLKPELRADLMARLCVRLAACAREALAGEEPDIASARAFVDLLQEAQKVPPPLSIVGSYGLEDTVVASIDALFLMATSLGVGPRFESEWQEAWTFARSGALGPGANSNGDALAGITDRAKAQITACLSKWPVPAGATPIPLICIDHGPNFAGMFHDRDEASDDIWAADGFELVLWLDNAGSPPLGKTLDFDGERFVLI
jgi:hypothetical protein